MRSRASTLPAETHVRLLSLAATGIPLAGLAASAATRTWSWFYVSGAAGVVLFAGVAFASHARHRRLREFPWRRAAPHAARKR